MATLHVNGSLSRARAVAADALRGLDVEITRTKIERDLALPCSEGALYLEHHVLLENDAWTRAVEACRRHGARLATNAHNGARFATMRHYGIDARASLTRADAFVEELVRAGVVVRELISERCVHDDNTTHDHRWRTP